MHTFSSPSLLSSSFYVRLSISPCGRYLASGSSGNGFSTNIWDLKTHSSARQVYGETRECSVALKGNTEEVSGIDWADDTVSDPLLLGTYLTTAMTDVSHLDSSPLVEMTSWSGFGDQMVLLREGRQSNQTAKRGGTTAGHGRRRRRPTPIALRSLQTRTTTWIVIDPRTMPPNARAIDIDQTQ